MEHEQHSDGVIQQVAIDMAVVKEQMKTLNEKLDNSIDTADNAFKDIYSKLSKYDIVLGKAGLVVTAVLFILTVIFTNAIGVIRELFTKQ
jgi:hypothetical protein